MAASAKRPSSKLLSTDRFNDYIPDDVSEFGRPFFGDDGSFGPDGELDGTNKPRSSETADLGIDEQVSVKKGARAPRVKLDEARLLSDKGIPALQKRAKHLKFKGKGHEFSDAAQLLSMYQLWLDDLFPKGRFADALVMVEKEGHKASMHKMRMEWIDESRPKDRQDYEDGEPKAQGGSLDQKTQKETQSPERLLSNRPDPVDGIEYEHELREEDFFDADMIGSSFSRHNHAVTNAREGRNQADIPDEDELDALMEEAMAVHESGRDTRAAAAAATDEFDDLDAMMAEAEAAAS